LKTNSGCWSFIELDSPVLEDFICQARARIQRNEAVFFGLNSLCIYPDCSEGFEWYELGPYAGFPNENTGANDTPLTCKAFKIPPTAHTARGWFHNPCVSERFVSIVHQHHLTGVDFVWVKDIGKYKAPQWFIPVPSNPLGRGVDHPWYKPPMLDRVQDFLTRDVNWRMGKWRFDVNELQRLGTIPQPFRDVFELFLLSKSKNPHTSDSLTIMSNKRYLREFLPSSDFAYIWDDSQQEMRRLCLSARARAIFLAEGVIRPDELDPIQIIEELPPGCRQLDGIGNMPPSCYTPEQVASLKAQLAEDWQKHAVTEKPLRSIKLKEALSLIRSAKRSRADDFTKAAKAAVLSNLPFALPDDWKAVLSISNGGTLADECLMLPVDDIAHARQVKTEEMTHLFDDVPYDPPLLPIAKSPDGDWYGLMPNAGNGVSRVLRISHEDWSAVDTWDSIPLFIFDMLCDYSE
jgi:hypothetical protein